MERAVSMFNTPTSSIFRERKSGAYNLESSPIQFTVTWEIKTLDAEKEDGLLSWKSMVQRYSSLKLYFFIAGDKENPQS